MNKKLLELRASILNEFEDMINEHGTNCIQGTWLQLIDQELHTQAQTMFREIDSKIQQANELLENLLEQKEFSHLLNEGYMADIFMHTSDLKATTITMQNEYGPK